MKNVLRFILPTITAISMTFSATAQTPEREKETIQPTEVLPYRAIVVPTTRYDKVFSISTSLLMVGATVVSPEKQKCLEVFDTLGAVQRATCIEADAIQDLYINDKGVVAGVASTSPDRDLSAFVLFRWRADNSVEMIPRPQETAQLPFMKIHGIDTDNRVVGRFATDEYGNLGDSDYSSTAFVATPGQPVELIAPPGSLGTSFSGLSGTIASGLLRKAALQNSGFDTFGWMYDTSTGVTTLRSSEQSEILGVSSNGDYLVDFGSSDRFVSSEGKELNLQYLAADSSDQTLKRDTAIEATALSLDGYRVWSNGNTADQVRVERNGKLSRSLDCAVPNTSYNSRSVTAMATGGIVLMGDLAVDGSNPVVFVPTETDQLENYCLLANFVVPKREKGRLKVGRSCNAGYWLQQKQKIKDGTVITIPIQVFNGEGKAVVDAQVSIDVTNDGKPAILKRRTDGRGIVRLPVPFFDKSRANKFCDLSAITISKRGHYSTYISVHNPTGSCGSCA